jgi:hypothetical protein
MLSHVERSCSIETRALFLHYSSCVHVVAFVQGEWPAAIRAVGLLTVLPYSLGCTVTCGIMQLNCVVVHDASSAMHPCLRSYFITSSECGMHTRSVVAVVMCCALTCMQRVAR